MTVKSRVTAAMKLLPPADNLNQYDLLAARTFFSVGEQLEEIAVLAGKAGNGIPEQLEDELVHRAVFGLAAEKYGGKLKVSPAITNLVSYLSSLTLDPEVSLVALNLVGESWLDCVFSTMGEHAFEDLFQLFSIDEHRHAGEAFNLPVCSSERAAPIVAHIESLLMEASRAPDLMVPLSYFCGLPAMADMALKQARTHTNVCKHLGIEPGKQIIQLRADCIAAKKQAQKVQRLDLTPWEHNKLAVWDRVVPMQYCIEFPYQHARDFAKAELEVVHAIAETLKERHELNRVTRRGELYQLSISRVGVRRFHTPGLILTIPVEYASLEDMQEQLRKRLRDARERPYERLTTCRAMHTSIELLQLLPVSEYSVAITQCSQYGDGRGLAYLDDVEGCSAVVTISSPAPNVLYLGCIYDHRVGDGEQIAMLLEQVKRKLCPK